jgi:hypothetical protein
MAIKPVNQGKNTGAPVTTAGNGNGQGADFESQLAQLKQVSEIAIIRSMELRQVSTALRSAQRAADEKA